MAQKNPPARQVEFGGIYTAGDILKRPANSAVVCKDFRVMPGRHLRLRGGRTLWIDAGTGSFSTLYEFRKGEFGGGIFHIAEHGGKWKKLDLPSKAMTDLETIGTDNPPTPGVAATVRDKAFWTNGHGSRGSGESKPALSSWDGTLVRYVGLDPFIPGVNSLAANFTVDAGGSTVIRYHRTFYAGLYNATTGHFSNGVKVGKITNPDLETDYIGNLSIAGLSSIDRVGHDATELAEVYYVIYCTLDGGEVPYLVMETDGLNPVKTQSSSQALVLDDNAASGTANLLDIAKEMPLDNFPPRGMNLIDYANGRVYYAPKEVTNGGSEVNFSYNVAARDETTVAWSASADDLSDRDFLGIPEESFPLSNKKSMPNGEAPRLIKAAGGNYGHVLVCTRSGTFLLQETLPGVHEWHAVSWTEGILDKDSHVRTPYGDIWMTQKKELVLLRPGDDILIHISKDYNSLFKSFGLTAKADYLYDPKNYIDRYQVWDASGKSVIHDFVLPGWGGPIPGDAYVTSNQSVTIAKTMDDQFDQRYHLMAIGSVLYAQEGHPSTGIVPTKDETTVGVYAEINGDYIGQWLDFGDHDIRKEFRKVSLIGDGNYSAALAKSPILFTWYGDMASTPAYDVEPLKANQSSSDNSYSAGIQDGNRFWYKFRVRISGHGDEGSYYLWQDDGELTPSVYGAIHRLLVTISGHAQNRP